MANNKSALKRIRQSKTRRVYNRYYMTTMRNAVKNFRALTDADEAEKQLPKVSSILDRMAVKGRIHKNKAANLKRSLAHHANNLRAEATQA
ncbi:MAG: 30S ribosomal protein S20 [Porphyromonas sp.]|nr:30S ribosomal protein S20 [Porphyromonas sp.]